MSAAEAGSKREAAARALTLRPLSKTDGPALERLGRRCDREDLRLRFFHVIGTADRRLLERLTTIDPARDLALIAFERSARTPLGVVRLHGDAEGDAAEFAILVRTDRQRRGYGRMLMERIIQEARRRGYRLLQGEILPENEAMIGLCRGLGFDLASTPEGVVRARLELATRQAA